MSTSAKRLRIIGPDVADSFFSKQYGALTMYYLGKLLWIRLTLANILRREQQSSAATNLFRGMTQPLANTGALLELPDQLLAVGQALPLVKRNSYEEADPLLRFHNVKWRHRETLWVITGRHSVETPLFD